MATVKREAGAPLHNVQAKKLKRDRNSRTRGKETKTLSHSSHAKQRFQQNGDKEPSFASDSDSNDGRPRKGGFVESVDFDDSKIAEATWDSDPIVESETASESGADDGISWPSDREADTDGQFQGFSEPREDEDGGVKLSEIDRSTREAMPKALDEPSGK